MVVGILLCFFEPVLEVFEPNTVITSTTDQYLFVDFPPEPTLFRVQRFAANSCSAAHPLLMLWARKASLPKAYGRLS